MKQNKADCPKYKVLVNYPGNKFPVGFIIQVYRYEKDPDTNELYWYCFMDGDVWTEKDFDQYPEIFQKQIP